MTYAAFYLPKDNILSNAVNAVETSTIKGQLTQAYSNAESTLQNFDLGDVARNINLQSATSFVQKYAVSALTMIINQRPVTNQMMLDSLFNGFAPALGITAAQTGFNSIMEMKAAVQAGNINVANFMQGFSNGLSVVTSTMAGGNDYSKYGEEITIDLLTNFTRNYTSETPDRKVQAGQTYNEYLHNLPLTLPFSGIIKDGYVYSAHEFSDRLEQVMNEKVPFTFRAGNKIFESYVFTSYVPRRELEDGIQFDAEIKYIETGTIEYTKVNIPRQRSGNTSGGSSGNKRIQTQNTKKNQSTKNKTTQNKYSGAVGLIEWVAPDLDISNKLDNLLK